MSAVPSILDETLVALARATLAIADTDDLKATLQTIADAVRQMVQAEYAAVGIPAATDQSLAAFIHSGLDPDAAARMPHLPRGEGLLGLVYRDKRPVRVENADQHPSAAGVPAGHPVVFSFLGVPILDQQSVLGNLYVINKIGAPGFSELDQRLLELVAAHTTVAVRKAQLRQQQQDQAAALRQRNRQLGTLNQAAIDIAGELALEKVLKQIVDSAKDLVEAEFAALGVPNHGGELETFVHSGFDESTTKKMVHPPRGLGLLRALIDAPAPIRIPKIGADPRSAGFPEGHPQMDSFLGVPVLAGPEILGNLYLTNKLTAPAFSLDDQEIVERLAAHAAVAIQNARLYAQVSQLAIIDERKRIGMDLHDGIIQSIYAVGLTLESTRLTLPPDVGEADFLLDHAIVALNDTIRDIRNFILDLRPHRFTGDLAEGLGRLVREFQANTVVPVLLIAPENVVAAIAPPVARALFLTTQEALANIARHAKAKQVHVILELIDEDVLLKVEDDGLGFDAQDQRLTVGHGLSNMRSRAEALQGRFEIESAPRAGTKVTLCLPAA